LKKLKILTASVNTNPTTNGAINEQMFAAMFVIPIMVPVTNLYYKNLKELNIVIMRGIMVILHTRVIW
jgi:hypothetical protein